jgi:hypothetical protein
MSEPHGGQIEETANRQCVEETGPWPFVTRRVYQAADQSNLVWSSRHHRKGLLVRAAREAEELAITLSSCLWMPQRLNWWIGAVFAIGSLLFALASVLSLALTIAGERAMDSTLINAIFFAGSIPFTIAVCPSLVLPAVVYRSEDVSLIPWWFRENQNASIRVAMCRFSAIMVVPAPAAGYNYFHGNNEAGFLPDQRGSRELSYELL